MPTTSQRGSHIKGGEPAARPYTESCSRHHQRRRIHKASPLPPPRNLGGACFRKRSTERRNRPPGWGQFALQLQQRSVGGGGGHVYLFIFIPTVRIFRLPPTLTTPVVVLGKRAGDIGRTSDGLLFCRPRSGEGGRTNATSIMRCSKAAQRNTDQILGLK